MGSMKVLKCIALDVSLADLPENHLAVLKRVQLFIASLHDRSTILFKCP